MVIDGKYRGNVPGVVLDTSVVIEAALGRDQCSETLVKTVHGGRLVALATLGLKDEMLKFYRLHYHLHRGRRREHYMTSEEISRVALFVARAVLVEGSSGIQTGHHDAEAIYSADIAKVPLVTRDVELLETARLYGIETYFCVQYLQLLRLI